MMRVACALLPVAFVRWYARRHCELFVINGRTYARPFRDVLVDMGPTK
jgi:hypothetical protein